MKFHQLPDGARFEFEGETYSKYGTLKACHERSGHLRVIRRSATVRPVEGAGPVKVPGGKTEAGIDAVLAAFDIFCSVCEKCLRDAAADSDAATLSATRERFDAARQQFLSSLDQPAD